MLAICIVPVSEILSEIGTHLLASSGIMEENRNLLACLWHAGFYFSRIYCILADRYSVRYTLLSKRLR
jgi:hypothetical protein